MSDNLLRDAMVEEARRWLDEVYPKGQSLGLDALRLKMAGILDIVLADFVMHMTGADAPKLRYVPMDATDPLHTKWRYIAEGEEKPAKRYARWNGEAMGCVICGMLTNNVCNICSGMICALHDESEAHAARDKDVEEGRAI